MKPTAYNITRYARYHNHDRYEIQSAHDTYCVSVSHKDTGDMSKARARRKGDTQQVKVNQQMVDAINSFDVEAYQVAKLEAKATKKRTAKNKPAVSYREMQKTLKALRSAGVAISCKLNAKSEVLWAEYQKHQHLMEVPALQELLAA